MPKTESACSRTPVEIWKEVFQYFLGPSSSNPRHSNVRDCKKHLFAHITPLWRSDIYLKSKIGTLRLVSRNWKLVADPMADQIVFINKPRVRMSANLSPVHAKHIYYGPGFPVTDFGDAPPLKLGEDAYLAQIVQVRGPDIIFSGSSTILPQDNVLAFNWEPPRNSRWFEKLAHESLRSLVALSLTLDRSPGYTERPTLDLPMLRYLHLFTRGCNAKYLTRWYFPILRLLSLQFLAESTASIGELLHRHSATIEELELTSDGDGDALAYCLGGLPRLKTYITGRFSTLNRALSQLDDVLGRTTGSNTSPNDRLVVQLLDENSFFDIEDFLTSLPRRFKKMKKNIHIQVWQSWGELTEQVEEFGRDTALAFYDMVKTIRTVPGIVFDSEEVSWRTEAARRFESAVVALVEV